VTEALQVIILAVVAFALSWRPRGGASGGFEVAALLVLGSAGCAGIGLALAGRLRAEVNLAASNGLYLVLLLLSGIVVPLTSLPSIIRRVAVALPPRRDGRGLHRVLGQGLMPTGTTGSTWDLGAARTARRGANVSIRLSSFEGPQSRAPARPWGRPVVNLLENSLGAHEHGLGNVGELEECRRARSVGSNAMGNVTPLFFTMPPRDLASPMRRCR